MSRAPSDARCSARASPSPWLAPVIHTTLPWYAPRGASPSSRTARSHSLSAMSTSSKSVTRPVSDARYGAPSAAVNTVVPTSAYGASSHKSWIETPSFMMTRVARRRQTRSLLCGKSVRVEGPSAGGPRRGSERAAWGAVGQAVLGLARGDNGDPRRCRSSSWAAALAETRRKSATTLFFRKRSAAGSDLAAARRAPQTQPRPVERRRPPGRWIELRGGRDGVRSRRRRPTGRPAPRWRTCARSNRSWAGWCTSRSAP